MNLKSKEANALTARENRKSLDYMPPLSSLREKYMSGLICSPYSDNIENEQGEEIYRFSKIDDYKNIQESNDSTNGTLFNIEKYKSAPGIYKVSGNIWQARGFGLSNMTFIRTDNGYIIVDPLANRELAMEAFNLFKESFDNIKITAVIFSNPNISFFGGIDGIAEANGGDEDFPIYAPNGFVEKVFSSKILISNNIKRRLDMVNGVNLENNTLERIGSADAKINYRSINARRPTDYIVGNKIPRYIDGLQIIFTNESNNFGGMIFYVPKLKLLYSSNIITDGIIDKDSIDSVGFKNPLRSIKFMESISLSYSPEYMCGLFGTGMKTFEKIKRHTSCYIRLYKFLHDQTVRMINLGMTLGEIKKEIKIPRNLTLTWELKPITTSYNNIIDSVHNFYLGKYKNGKALDMIEPEIEEVGKMLSSMLSIDSIIEEAHRLYSYSRFKECIAMCRLGINREEDKAKELSVIMSNALEQLGYLSSSSFYRNLFLSSAKELRVGLPESNTSMDRELLSQVPTSILLDYLSVKLDSKLCENYSEVFCLKVEDSGETFIINIKDSVLRYREVFEHGEFFSIRLNREKLEDIVAYGYNGEVNVIDEEIGRVQDFFDKFTQFNGSIEMVKEYKEGNNITEEEKILNDLVKEKESEIKTEEIKTLMLIDQSFYGECPNEIYDLNRNRILSLNHIKNKEEEIKIMVRRLYNCLTESLLDEHMLLENGFKSTGIWQFEKVESLLNGKGELTGDFAIIYGNKISDAYIKKIDEIIIPRMQECLRDELKMDKDFIINLDYYSHDRITINLVSLFRVDKNINIPRLKKKISLYKESIEIGEIIKYEELDMNNYIKISQSISTNIIEGLLVSNYFNELKKDGKIIYNKIKYGKIKDSKNNDMLMSNILGFKIKDIVSIVDENNKSAYGDIMEFIEKVKDDVMLSRKTTLDNNKLELIISTYDQKIFFSLVGSDFRVNSLKTYGEAKSEEVKNDNFMRVGLKAFNNGTVLINGIEIEIDKSKYQCLKDIDENENLLSMAILKRFKDFDDVVGYDKYSTINTEIIGFADNSNFTKTDSCENGVFYIDSKNEDKKDIFLMKDKAGKTIGIKITVTREE